MEETKNCPACGTELYRAEEEADNQPLPSKSRKANDAKHSRRNQVPLVEPAKLRVLREILDRFPIRAVVHIADNPADM